MNPLANIKATKIEKEIQGSKKSIPGPRFKVVEDPKLGKILFAHLLKATNFQGKPSMFGADLFLAGIPTDPESKRIEFYEANSLDRLRDKERRTYTGVVEYRHIKDNKIEFKKDWFYSGFLNGREFTVNPKLENVEDDSYDFTSQSTFTPFNGDNQKKAEEPAREEPAPALAEGEVPF